MLRPCCAFFALLFSLNAIAAFKITYPQDMEAFKRQHNSVLLLNNATEFVVEVGSGMADSVPGAAKNVPIGDALLLLTPKGWKAYGNDVDLSNVTVDLMKGEPWTETLARTGKDYDMIFTVDWARKEISVDPHLEKGQFGLSGMPVAESEAINDGPKRLHLQEGDLREALNLFAMLNDMKLQVDIFSEDRDFRVHPTVAEYTHPIPDCVSWRLPNQYNTVTSEWLTELNRILKPYRLKTFLFANNVIFLTSLHQYGDDFCRGKVNEQ